MIGLYGDPSSEEEIACIIISIAKCSRKENCESEENIDNWLLRKNFMFAYDQSIYEPGNYGDSSIVKTVEFFTHNF